MAPPFLTLGSTSPFNISPSLSPKSDDSEYSDTGISPLTPSPIHHHDLSRLSGFPQSSGFNFGLNTNNTNDTSPVSPSGERRPSEGAASLMLPRPAPNAIPGGVHREQNAESGEPAPPPYERYPHVTMPAGGVRASRISIVAHQYPTDPAGPAPVSGHHRFASAAGVHGAPRRFSGQRQLYPLTLADTQAPRQANAPSKGLKSQASWRIFGAVESLDGGSEKKSLSRKGKWGICIAAATILITVAIVGAIVGTSQPKAANTAVAQEFNISGFPPLPVGEATITPQADAEKPISTCVEPRTLWSCNLPFDTGFPTKSARSEKYKIPQFTFTIALRNSSRDDLEEQVLWAPVPEQIPNSKEYSALAEVDGIQSDNKAGEETNFYLSMQTDTKPITISQVTFNTVSNSTTDDNDAEKEPTTDNRGQRAARRSLSKRQEVTTPAQMLPLKLRNQPLRLFDRGLDTEHYGFYVYFNKTIRVVAPTPTDVTEFSQSNDMPSGVVASVTATEVKWEKTRFRVAIWTKRRASGEVDLIAEDGHKLAPQPGAYDNSFLYPVSVIEDRAGAKGEVSFKRKNFGPKTVVQEEEKDPKGCFCEWRNWRRA